MVILSTGLILLTWLLISAVLIGAGCFVAGRLFRPESLIDLFWVGLAVAVAVVQVAHLVAPVTQFVTLLVIVLGLIGLAGNRAKLAAHLQQTNVRKLSGRYICLCVAAICVALRCAGKCEHFDTGLYGISAVRWAQTYPALPGLANLHGRLGFNSAVLLCHALLDHWAWRGHSQHLFSGLLVVAMLAAVIPALSGLMGPTVSTAGGWFLGILFVPCATWALNAEIVGVNTDLPSTIVCLAAFSTLLRGLEAVEKRDAINARSCFLVAAILFSLCVAFKVTTVVIAALGWIISTTALALVDGPGNQRKIAVLKAMGLSGLMIIPWLFHGFVKSGFLAYPSTLASIPVDWRVPVVATNWDAAWIRSWARIPHATLSETQGFSWIRPWFQTVWRDREGFLVPLCISIISLLAYLISFAKNRRWPASSWIWLLVPSIAGLVFWFFEAPALRFGEPAIWVTAATLGTIGQRVIIDPQNRRLRRYVAIALLVVSFWSAHPRNIWRVRFRPVLSGGGLGNLPTVPVVQRKTESGLLVNIPLNGYQCWDAKLPCTPYFNSSLRLRRPGDMGSGFTSTQLADELEPSNRFCGSKCRFQR